jgi:hypothetical protein
MGGVEIGQEEEVTAASCHRLLRLPADFGEVVDEVWAKIDFVDFGAVVIHYELKDDTAAAAFRQRFITLNLNEDTGLESAVMELTNLVQQGSKLVQE